MTDMRKSTDAQIKAAAKYDKTNTKLIQLKLNKKTDADILDFLDGLDNRQGFIKELIRKHMNGSETVPVIDKKIIDGEFFEGKTVVVSIDGREFKRKVYKSSKLNDLAITVFNNEYGKFEFKQ
jgi:hypothetical protein